MSSLYLIEDDTAPSCPLESMTTAMRADDDRHIASAITYYPQCGHEGDRVEIGHHAPVEIPGVPKLPQSSSW
jgi:hypothetical protein